MIGKYSLGGSAVAVGVSVPVGEGVTLHVAVGVLVGVGGSSTVTSSQREALPPQYAGPG